MRKQNTLIVCDLDGTLLTSQKTISEETVNYFRRLEANGIKICLASGRPYRAVKPYYDQIGLHGYVICYNGSIIINPKNNDEILFKKAYPPELIKTIIKEIGEENFENIMVEDMHNIVFLKDNDALDMASYRNGMNIVYSDIEKNMIEEPLGALFALKNKDDVNKILTLGSTSKYTDVNIRFWHDTLIAELFFNDVNKYTSLSIVAKYYKYRNEDIICLGDADNDIEMIHRCGIGVGMKNSMSKFVKQTADLISLDDNDHDGVRKTLELLIH